MLWYFQHIVWGQFCRFWLLHEKLLQLLLILVSLFINYGNNLSPLLFLSLNNWFFIFIFFFRKYVFNIFIHFTFNLYLCLDWFDAIFFQLVNILLSCKSFFAIRLLIIDHNILVIWSFVFLITIVLVILMVLAFNWTKTYLAFHYFHQRIALECFVISWVNGISPFSAKLWHLEVVKEALLLSFTYLWIIEIYGHYFDVTFFILLTFRMSFSLLLF